MVSIADALRVYCALTSLTLVPLCIYCMTGPMALDQRLRYAALAVIGFVVTAGQIAAFGDPGHWRLPVLAIGMSLAVAGTVAFLIKRRGEGAGLERGDGGPG